MGTRIKFPKYRPFRAAELLSMPEAEGKTKLEQQVWTVAHEMNIRFDDAQKWLPLSGGYEATICDFWIANPPTAIFVDGPQHDFRDDVKRDDLNKRTQLKSMGIRVVVLTWQGILNNARAEVAKILYGQ